MDGPRGEQRGSGYWQEASGGGLTVEMWGAAYSGSLQEARARTRQRDVQYGGGLDNGGDYCLQQGQVRSIAGGFACGKNKQLDGRRA